MSFYNPERKCIENIVDKEENAGKQLFFLIPQCFLTFQTWKSPFKY